MKKITGFFLLQGLLLLVLIGVWVHEPPKPIIVTIVGNEEANLSKPLELFTHRVNKYGGVNGHKLILEYREKPRGITLDVGSKPAIVLKDGIRLELTRKIRPYHLNYRMSGLKSDCKRKLERVIRADALHKIKGLDIIISSIEANKKISEHHYFNCRVVSKQHVKVGLSMVSLSKIDMPNVKFHADFYIWFKWVGEGDEVTNIEFVNTEKPSFLLHFQNSSIETVRLERADDEGESHYRLYRVIGDFVGLEKKNYVLGEQNLPIRFRNSKLDTTGIVYIHDNDNTGGVYSKEIPSTPEERAEANYNLVRADGLKLNYTLAYSSFGSKSQLGKVGKMHISEYTTRYALKATGTSIRGFEGSVNTLIGGREGELNSRALQLYLIVSLMLFIALTYFSLYYRPQGIKRVGLWAIRFVVMMALLMCLEFVLSDILFSLKGTNWGASHLYLTDSFMVYLEYFIALIWWIAPAIYTASAIDNFIWCPIEERTGTIIPRVLKVFVSAVIYVLAFIGILAYVFEVTTSSLMATSGVFAILFAVLSKVDVTNIVAGLGISFAKVIKIGDWVKIGDSEGLVIAITARAVKLRNPNNAIINIPNREVGDAVIKNMGENPYRVHIHLEVVPMDYKYVERALLEGVNNVLELSKKKDPFVAFLGQGDSAQIFEVYFFLDGGEKKGAMIDKVWREVWSACAKYDIEMSTPQREHFNFDMGRKG